jgi:hypothetical protein
MFIAASAYIPPNTCQGVRSRHKTELLSEFRHFFPPKGFSEDVGELLMSRNLFQPDLLVVQQFIDDVKFSVNMSMGFTSATVLADMDRCFIVREYQRRSDRDELG